LFETYRGGLENALPWCNGSAMAKT
jgi:hypothetical protein